MKKASIEWENWSNGDGVVAIVKSGKYEYELWAYRMNDEYNRKYPSNATGYKYSWSVSTTETFYDGCEGTQLVDGYAMTLDEAIRAMEDAFTQRNKYRKEWRESATR